MNNLDWTSKLLPSKNEIHPHKGFQRVFIIEWEQSQSQKVNVSKGSRKKQTFKGRFKEQGLLILMGRKKFVNNQNKNLISN